MPDCRDDRVRNFLGHDFSPFAKDAACMPAAAALVVLLRTVLLRRFEQRIEHRVPHLRGAETRCSPGALRKRTSNQVLAEIVGAASGGKEVVPILGRGLLEAV